MVIPSHVFIKRAPRLYLTCYPLYFVGWTSHSSCCQVQLVETNYWCLCWQWGKIQHATFRSTWIVGIHKKGMPSGCCFEFWVLHVWHFEFWFLLCHYIFCLTHWILTCRKIWKLLLYMLLSLSGINLPSLNTMGVFRPSNSSINRLNHFLCTIASHV